VLANLKKK
jgi:SpoVK/Ycf46/Vps4 family AAA+-type ATPase